MDSQEIEMFLTLAEELHFGRTADRLRVSTARVSQTIRKLERRVGAPLFARTSRVVTLTPLGRRFRDDLAPAYRGVLDALSRAVAAGHGLNVGFLGPAAGDFLAGTAAAFTGCAVRFHETRPGDVLRTLRDGTVDVVLTKFPVREPDLTTGPVLLREPRLLAVAAGHALAARAAVYLDEVAGEPHLDIAGPVPGYWRAHHLPAAAPGGRPIRRGPAAATLQEAMMLVAAGAAVCGVDGTAAASRAWPGVAFVPLRDAPPFESGLVWRSAAETGSVRAFARAAEEHSGR